MSTKLLLQLIKYNKINTLKKLIPNIDINIEANKWGWTPLHCAAYNGHLEIARYLIVQLEAHQIPIHTEDNNGKTPIVRAFEAGHPAIVRLLLEHGAK